MGSGQSKSSKKGKENAAQPGSNAAAKPKPQPASSQSASGAATAGAKGASDGGGVAAAAAQPEAVKRKGSSAGAPDAPGSSGDVVPFADDNAHDPPDDPFRSRKPEVAAIAPAAAEGRGDAAKGAGAGSDSSADAGEALQPAQPLVSAPTPLSSGGAEPAQLPVLPTEQAAEQHVLEEVHDAEHDDVVAPLVEHQPSQPQQVQIAHPDADDDPLVYASSRYSESGRDSSLRASVEPSAQSSSAPVPAGVAAQEAAAETAASAGEGAGDAAAGASARSGAGHALNGGGVRATNADPDRLSDVFEFEHMLQSPVQPRKSPDELPTDMPAVQRETPGGANDPLSAHLTPYHRDHALPSDGGEEATPSRPKLNGWSDGPTPSKETPVSKTPGFAIHTGPSPGTGAPDSLYKSSLDQDDEMLIHDIEDELDL